MKIIVYVLITLALVPLFIIGACFYFVPIVRLRGTVSGTAYEPFNARVLYHLMSLRPDPAALQLTVGLPGTNRGVMVLMMKPLAWASRVSGYVPAALAYPAPRPTPMLGMVAARCEFLDDAMITHVSAGDQVVILGAGWDTRAYGLIRDSGATIFEVDAPATQAVKRKAIETAGLDASHVTFVSCDFERESWLDALGEHGFDTRTRTFVLWEGVNMYLEEHAVQSTLRSVSTLPAGSRIAFDFFSREWLQSTAGKSARRGVALSYGEAFIFGFPTTPELVSRLGAYLEEQGLGFESHRVFGEGDGRKPTVGGLVLAVRS